MSAKLCYHCFMNIILRESVQTDLANYTSMMQETYENAYVDDSIGLTKECFSNRVFDSDDTQSYLKSKLMNTDNQKSWVALDAGRIIGSIVVEDKGVDYELTGFYVLPSYQGHGIGKKLWSYAKKFARNKDIVLDIYFHNKKTIELYKHWGFEEDLSRPHFYRHWPEWPPGLQAECIYMHLKQ